MMTHHVITTFTGRSFDLLDPRPSSVCIEDIAHALAQICHWGGHSREFFSVAQHSVLVSRLAPKHLNLWGLMHDAGEAYCGDVVRPLKQLLPEYKVIEERALATVSLALHLPWPLPFELKPWDNMALAMEARAFMAADAIARHPAPIGTEGDDRWGLVLVPQTPAQAEISFLERYAVLTRASVFMPAAV